MDWIKIGRLGSVHGLKGELKIIIETAFEEDVETLRAVFVERKGQKTPQFIEYFRGEYSQIVKLEEIDSPEAAAAFAQQDLYARRSDLSMDTEQKHQIGEAEYDYLAGYEVWNQDQVLGQIERIELYPHQEMAILPYQGREVLIPLVAAFIQSQDHQAKRLYLDLPEGLLDL